MRMTDTPIKQLDDLLIRWHRWASSEGYGTGYPSQSTYCRMYRPSRQYDDSNGSLDASIEDRLMTSVDAVIHTLNRQHVAALSVNARNLSTGSSVWNSPRLPQGEELLTLIAGARDALRDALDDAGLW